MPQERRKRCTPVTPEVAEEIRKAVRIAIGFEPFLDEHHAARQLGLSRANTALFILGDPSVPLEKLPWIGRQRWRSLVEAFLRAADRAAELDRGDASDELAAAAGRLDPGIAEWWRKHGRKQRACWEARNSPIDTRGHERGVYHGAEEPFIVVYDSDRYEILKLRVDGASSRKRTEIAHILSELLDVMDPVDDDVPGDAGDDDEDAGEQWKGDGGAE